MPVSWVDADKMKEEARRVDMRDMKWVEEVCDRLNKGLHWGVEGKQANIKSTYEEGQRMAQGWQTVCGHLLG